MNKDSFLISLLDAHKELESEINHVYHVLKTTQASHHSEGQASLLLSNMNTLVNQIDKLEHQVCEYLIQLGGSENNDLIRSLLNYDGTLFRALIRITSPFDND
mgnify:CR=1 FL=1